MHDFSSGDPGLPSSLTSASVASIVGAVQQAAIAASSIGSAVYFALRATAMPIAGGPQTSAEARARRLAAALLALLLAGVAVEAIAGLPVASTSTEVVRRVPLLAATVGIAGLVAYRPRSAR